VSHAENQKLAVITSAPAQDADTEEFKTNVWIDRLLKLIKLSQSMNAEKTAAKNCF
jgi:hypothetical protein